MDIKQLAKASGLPKYMYDTEGGRDALAKFAGLVAGLEREACAMECDTIMERHSIKAAKARSTEECEFRDAEACGAEDCSEAIRMRSNSNSA